MGNSKDQLLAQEVQQGIKDDESLSSVADTIHVIVKGGTITLEGEVSTEKEMNLAASTAMAIGVVDKINNHLEVTHQRKSGGLNENQN